MSADAIELSPSDEARRLWATARERWAAGGDVVPLLEAIDLGVHAAEILVVGVLQSSKSEFPATIGALLAMPTPEVDPHRDGIHVPRILQFTDAIDLLSTDDAECVSPGLHRGWEDRRFACRRSRAIARAAAGVTLSEAEQAALLLVAAYRNRLFRFPPPVRVVPDDVRAAWPALEALMTRLLPDA